MGKVGQAKKEKDLSAAMPLRISLIISYKARRMTALLLALVTGFTLPITPLSERHSIKDNLPVSSRIFRFFYGSSPLSDSGVPEAGASSASRCWKAS